MAGLTYLFVHWGPHPLDEAFATERSPTRPAPASTAPVAPAPRATEPPTGASPSAVTDFAPASPGDELALPLPLPPEPEAPAARSADTERAAAARPPHVEHEEPNELRFSLPADPPGAENFPEFSDSSRPRVREHAADGPRVGALFERAETERAAASEPTAAGDVAPRAPVALTSCEAAVARNNEQLELGAPRGPADITREAYAGVLQNGGYLRGCSIPEQTVFEICAAVKNGRAVGVTVVSNPASAELNACVRRAVSRLQFPSSERLDVTHTRFDAVKR
jgi:hypothetical protein